jgi:ribosomal protein S18 acetylase RimI-like enzyme
MMIEKGYTKEDLPHILRINEAAYSDDLRPPSSLVTSMLVNCDLFIAKECDPWPHRLATPIGFAIVQEMECPYLFSIAVHPDCQGRGVGGNLLREVTKTYYLQKRDYLRLHVHVDNPAQKLYYDYGFRVIDISKDYYATGQHGLLMEKKL